MHTVDEVNVSRRRFLTNSANVVGAVGSVFVAVPFLSSWAPSEKAKAAGAPVAADVSKLEPGAMVIIEWRGKPVWIVNRTPEMLATLPEVANELRDPDSSESTQPPYVDAELRSIKPNLLIMEGICTHLGCSPKYYPEPGDANVGPDWAGGFFCPCHGSKFDFAGRVYTGVPAPQNMVIPPHKYLSDTNILIGEDMETS